MGNFLQASNPMTDSLETSEAEALSTDHFPDAGKKVEPPALISVPAAAVAGKESGNG